MPFWTGVGLTLKIILSILPKPERPAQYGAASTLIITPEIKSQFDDGIENYQSGRSQSLRSAYNYVM